MDKIVVGIDGSETARRALEWAAAEARLRGARLVVVHAWQQPAAALMSPYAPLLADPGSLAETARQTLTDTLKAADLSGLASEPEQLVVQGAAASALIDAAENSLLLVVGSRGRGGVAGLLLGSVSRQVAHESTVPVVIIPPTATASDAQTRERDG
ncbi:nucleotide-binding universal stress UspA family protein [Kribbella pratensis]|jgi:nucleotide-binding universal stress UspA family protein|uniref:Nucleotide-binding universal stress UspA family protein n=1 Tax=Kribbella pratensis TaxID=2512112 RepID=A0ABY2F7I6_9ACTN|nr:universal stress protein [Kribbella pratensis]TDW84345.1 nucleotide-binding universal stress UspA family protein [Kribbella pratensis]